MEFNYKRIKEPTFFAENKLPACSDHAFYASRTEAESGRGSFHKSLNGMWKFHYARNPSGRPEGFQSLACDCGEWTEIRVPAHIQTEGWDVPHYANIQYPWDGREEVHPGEIPEVFNPVASYTSRFDLPQDWDPAAVFISFKGVESAFALWLNGHYIGYAADSFTPSDFDLSAHVRAGANKLAVQVFKWSGSSWIEDQDFFRFSGIFRDVVLYTKPKGHIEDIKIETHFESGFDRAVLKIACRGKGEGSVRWRLLRQGRLVLESQTPLAPEFALEGGVDAPDLWSAETPNLYDLEIELADPAGTQTEFIKQRIGFRAFEIVDGVMRINGKRIEFLGVNRHEFAPPKGRVMSREQTEADIKIMKRHNINALRTCHYPNNSFLYELCDEYGLYVIDEMNLESHGIWDLIIRGEGAVSDSIPGDKPEWLENLLDRANSLYQRDKNHACILIWSCGNESFGGSNILAAADALRALDGSRPIHYEGISADRRYEGSSDIESRMYLPADAIPGWMQEHPEKPMILCEYAHAMGNSFGAVDAYIALMRREPRFQGGFIWDFSDQVLPARDRYGRAYDAYGGDFGDRPTDYDFSGNGIVFGDRRLSPKMKAVKALYQGFEIIPSATGVSIVNHHLFISADACECRAVLLKDGKECLRVPIDVAVSPGTRGDFPLPFDIPEAPGEYALTVSLHLKENNAWAEAGYEIAFGQCIIRRAAGAEAAQDGVKNIAQNSIRDRAAAGEIQGVIRDRAAGDIAGSFRNGAGDAAPGGAAAPAVELIRGRHNFGFRGADFDALFSRVHGGMVSYRVGPPEGRMELLGAIPQPNFWRAPTSNDRGWCMPALNGVWLAASRYPVLLGKGFLGESLEANPAVTTVDGLPAIVYRYALPTQPLTYCNVTWFARADGALCVRMDCTLTGDLPDMPEFGMLFKINAGCDRLEWYGDGPEECYSDRRQGAKLGIYTADIGKQLTPYIRPQEAGNHTGVRWARVTDAEGYGILMESAMEGGMEFSALPWTPFEIENAAHPNELPAPMHTVLRPALARMGVGGDDSWGAKTHDAYRLPTEGALSFSFSMKGVQPYCPGTEEENVVPVAQSYRSR